MNIETVTEYERFLERKKVQARRAGFEPGAINPKLFPFQRHVVQWSLRLGRAAIFSECGTGKTPMQAEWARHIVEHTGAPVLIAAPLAVTGQTVEEGLKFDVPIKYVRTQADVGKAAVYVTNYDMLKEFDGAAFGGVVLDESSILKAYTGATKRMIIEKFRNTRYKLACTATPAPNDHMELGNHAEFLNVMDSNEMLSRWFINDTMKAGGYRLKRSAEADYWRWVASWAIAFERPSDIGFSDERFTLPALHIEQHTVSVDHCKDAGDSLFRTADLSATSLHKEMRLTAPDRAQRVAELVNGDQEHWIVWCNTNYEADELIPRIPGAIEVRGSESLKAKEQKLSDFTHGRYRVIITKPDIAGFGLNWQHVSRMAFVGLSYSYEQLYQALRRSWRYGQKHEVQAHIVCADTEGPVLRTVREKQAAHERMKAQMVAAMRGRLNGGLKIMDYHATKEAALPAWMNGDSK